MRDVIFEEVSRHLRYVRMSGPDNIGGPCPFHKGGMERNPSFYVNLNNGLFHCHTCKASGTFVQFLKRFNTPSAIIDSVIDLGRREDRRRPREVVKEHVINEGLLGVFQYCPVDLVKAGFDEGLLQELEIGFDKEEMRIVFPLRNLRGSLVGLSGRTVRDEFPRYKVYKSEDLLRFAPHDYEVIARYKAYDIKNHNHLWNMHAVYPSAFFGDLDSVIVVEGYKACIWMIQNGFPNTVALQGSTITRAQVDILSRLGGTIVLFLDNNQAGKDGTYTTGWWLRRANLRVRAVSYPDWCDEKTQPDDLEQPVLEEAVSAAQDWYFWRKQHDGELGKAKKLIRAKSKRLHYQKKRELW